MKSENNTTKSHSEAEKATPSETALHTNGSGGKRDGRANKNIQQQNQKELKVNHDHRSEDMAKHKRGTFP